MGLVSVDCQLLKRYTEENLGQVDQGATTHSQITNFFAKSKKKTFGQSLDFINCFTHEGLIV